MRHFPLFAHHDILYNFIYFQLEARYSQHLEWGKPLSMVEHDQYYKNRFRAFNLCTWHCPMNNGSPASPCLACYSVEQYAVRNLRFTFHHASLKVWVWCMQSSDYSYKHPTCLSEYWKILVKIYDSKPTHGSMSSHAVRISSSDGVHGRNGIVRKNRSVASPCIVATVLLVEFSITVVDAPLILNTLVSKLLKKAEAKDMKLVSGRNSKSSLSITKLRMLLLHWCCQFHCREIQV